MPTKWNQSHGLSERVALTASGLPILLGLLVLFGWHWQAAILTQIRPGYIAMAYNTALAFVAAGLGIWAVQYAKMRMAIACASFVSGLGLLNAAEHLFSANLGIDELLMTASNAIASPNRGRMAPNTAICFILIGSAILLACSKRNSRPQLVGLGSLGALSGALGLVPLLGYLMGIPGAYTWGSNMYQMAVHSATGFVCLGTALLAIAWRKSREVTTGLPEWIPWLAGIAGGVMTLLFWQALVSQNHLQMDRSLTEAQETAEARIKGTLRAYSGSLERMTLILGNRVHSQREWVAESDPWLQSGGFSAILSLDPGRELWMATNEVVDYERLLRVAGDILREPTPGQTGDRQARLVVAGRQVAVMIPSQHMPGAFVLGIIPFSRSLDGLMSNGATADHAVLLTNGIGTLYERNSSDRAYQRRAHVGTVSYLDINWQLSVWPTTRSVLARDKTLPSIALGVGLLFTALLILTTHLAMTSYSRALQVETAERQLRLANDGLEVKIRDRTADLRLANDELNRIAQQYRFMADSMPQIVWTSKPDGNLNYYNRRWYDYTGLTFEQTKNWGWESVLHPDDVKNCVDRWTRSFTSGEAYEVEYRFKNASDGVYRWHLGRAVPRCDEDGRIVEWFGTCTDIDDYKRADSDLRHAREQLERRVQQRTAELTFANASLRAGIVERQVKEQQLSDQKEQFRLTLETAHDAFICIDAEGSIIEWNRQAALTFGWSKHEVTGLELADLIMPPEQQDTHSQWLAKYFSSGRGSVLNQITELQAVRRDGLIIPLEVTVWPVRDGGNVRFNAFLRDIGVRKQMELDLINTNAELQQRNIQVEQASRMKSAFLANMSHELRTPLNGIIGFTELLVDGVTGPVSAEQKACLEDVLSSSRHLLSLINDVLDVAKVESGTMVFKPERIEISNVVMDAVSGLRPLALQKNIRLAVDVDTEALAAVWLDPRKLKQVILNYLSNALKFTASNGSITVRVRPEKELWFRLEVEDTGIGIAERDIRRLFQEFRQLDGGYSKQFQGTGLGLAVTKRLVEAQGGQVGVESTIGIGSKFFAVFPCGIEQLARPELVPSVAT